jgi:pilus assembly protein CpaF
MAAILKLTNEGRMNAAHTVDLGIITPFMQDDSITDILINGTDSIYVERAGKMERTDIHFQNNREVLDFAHRIVQAIGRELDSRRPLVDARLHDGSRVNIVSWPLAVDGTMISIRKFARKSITIEQMVAQKNISPQMGEFLIACGRSRLNILISGGTGSGKTTTLNAISEHIHDSERIVTVEDAAELKLIQPQVVRLETRPANDAETEEVTVRDLVRNALRMRPDRIIVGEVRGAEAFDMMQAMNSGHEGSLTTIHANHPRDAIARLENMISTASLSLSPKAVRTQIVSALHLIIQVSRMRDGVRRITHIAEIIGMEGDVVTMQDLFHFVPKGLNAEGVLEGEFQWNKIVPRAIRRFAYWGEAERISKALGINVSKL